ncbi:hypothetical protein DYB28_013146, partial [Aphanomyces astaci]
MTRCTCLESSSRLRLPARPGLCGARPLVGVRTRTTPSLVTPGKATQLRLSCLARRRRWSVRWILALSSLGTNHSAPKWQELSQHPVNSQSEISIQMLLKLASDEATSDDAMFQAIEDALPYPKRIGTTTFWIDTSDALMSQTNDKIIKSLFEDNKDAPWAHLMQDFVQVNKARGGDVVVTV